MKGLSNKEIKVVSYLELNNKRFFLRNDIKKFFKDKNQLNFFIHKLKIKNRIIKMNNDKYYLVPIKAYEGRWTEHPYIIIDEIFNSGDYYIGGNSALNYYGIINQISNVIDVYSKKKQGRRKILNINIKFHRVRKLNEYSHKKMNNHYFNIKNKNAIR